jgi:uncharacterized membrane protein
VLQIVLALVNLGAVAFLLSLVGLLLGVGLLAVSILLMIKANGNEEIELPVIGPMARKWA